MGVFQFPELEASQGLVKNSQVQGEEWMAHLRPVMMNMTLREIQFPGAYHCLSKLQNWSITDQLRLGIRAFESAPFYNFSYEQKDSPTRRRRCRHRPICRLLVPTEVDIPLLE